MYQGDATGSACAGAALVDACSCGAPGAADASACARSRATRSDQRTSVAPPRSGNGTSIVSKSRAASVAGKTALASSRSSPPA